jgi:hypothetical protein
MNSPPASTGRKNFSRPLNPPAYSLLDCHGIRGAEGLDMASSSLLIRLRPYIVLEAAEMYQCRHSFFLVIAPGLLEA